MAGNIDNTGDCTVYEPFSKIMAEFLHQVMPHHALYNFTELTEGLIALNMN